MRDAPSWLGFRRSLGPGAFFEDAEKVDARADVHFAEDVGDVVVDGVDGDVKLVGNFFVCKAVTDKLNDFEFAFGDFVVRETFETEFGLVGGFALVDFKTNIVVDDNN